MRVDRRAIGRFRVTVLGRMATKIGFDDRNRRRKRRRYARDRAREVKTVCRVVADRKQPKIVLSWPNTRHPRPRCPRLARKRALHPPPKSPARSLANLRVEPLKGKKRGAPGRSWRYRGSGRPGLAWPARGERRRASKQRRNIISAPPTIQTSPLPSIYHRTPQTSLSAPPEPPSAPPLPPSRRPTPPADRERS